MIAEIVKESLNKVWFRGLEAYFEFGEVRMFMLIYYVFLNFNVYDVLIASGCVVCSVNCIQISIKGSKILRR